MANELELRIKQLAEAIAADIKTLYAKDGSLTGLTTTDKTSLVNAINEVKSLIASGGGGDMLASNNLSELVNMATARTNLDVRSSAQVTSEITSAIAAITLASLGGLSQAQVDARIQTIVVDAAPAALDTLKEFADALGNDANFSATITTALGNRVRYDAAQTLTVPQRAQACANIGVGNPDRNFVTDYTTVRDA